MKRTKALLAATGAAAVMLLAACSSTGGTPTAATGQPQVQTTQNSAPTGQTGATDSGTTDSGSTDSGTTDSTDAGSTDSGSTDSTSADSGNSGSVEGVDAATVTWATTYCEGLKPVVQQAQNMTDLQNEISSDPQSGLKKAGELFKNWGDAFTTTADKLKNLPAPGVSGGQEFADKSVPLLSEVGTTFTTLGDKFIQGDVSSASELAPSLTKMGQTISGLGSDPELAAAFAKVPACKGLTS